MYRTYLAALVMACAAVALGVPTTGAEEPSPKVGERGNGLSIGEEQYLALYAEAQRKFGSGAVGANVVDDGMGGHEAYNLPEKLVAQKAAALDSMLHPPPPPEPVTTESYAPTETYAAEPVTYSTGGCPASMAGEADSPSDVNPSSGAAGCYQVIPSTAAAMGSACADVNSSSCLAAICASQGNGAWSASGAAPCG